MKSNHTRVFCLILLLFCLSACQVFNQDEEISTPIETVELEVEQPDEVHPPQELEQVEIVKEIGTGGVPEGALPPEALQYLGAFRLPEDTGEMGWGYIGHGLTFYSDGNPQGAGDSFPGSLFIVGHDQQLNVAEIGIPQPIISKNLEELNAAQILQPLADITGGAITDNLDIPRMGIEYLPSQPGQGEEKLHFCIGQHFQEFEPSHGWASLNLSDPNPGGLWVLDGYTNYTTNDYLFAIPQEWASAYTANYVLATGRFREGVWGGFGPALFAYTPYADGNPPAPGTTLTAVQPLLLYGTQVEGAPDLVTDDTMRMDGYAEADHWWGGAWLTSAQGDAVIFTGTKAQGENWYGFANGVVWAYDCAENPEIDCPDVPDFPYEDRGYWADDFIPAILFFDPVDLGKVAQGELATYEPQPYAMLDLSDYWLDPEINVEIYKRDLVGAAAFDRANGLLYIIERLADEYQSVIHVFQIKEN